MNEHEIAAAVASVFVEGAVAGRRAMVQLWWRIGLVAELVAQCEMLL